jgi:hypothetical protein
MVILKTQGQRSVLLDGAFQIAIDEFFLFGCFQHDLCGIGLLSSAIPDCGGKRQEYQKRDA